MKRSGFTLVELLAVIVLLGLVMIIVATNGLGVFNKTKEGINKIEEDNLLEAAKTFLVDIENGFCTEDSEFNVSCSSTDYIESYSLPVGYILKYYMDGGSNHCNAKDENGNDFYLNVKIETDENGNITDYISEKENVEDVICSN